MRVCGGSNFRRFSPEKWALRDRFSPPKGWSRSLLSMRIISETDPSCKMCDDRSLAAGSGQKPEKWTFCKRCDQNSWKVRSHAAFARFQPILDESCRGAVVFICDYRETTCLCGSTVISRRISDCVFQQGLLLLGWNIQKEAEGCC